MARFKLEGGAIVDTDRAAQSWDEASDWDGHNWISKATGGQWNHQKLFRSSKGRYYIVHSSNWEGVQDTAEEITPREAAVWLLHNEHDLPEDLASFEAEVLMPHSGRMRIRRERRAVADKRHVVRRWRQAVILSTLF